MKAPWTGFVVMTIVAFPECASASCASDCQAQLVHFREDVCQSWREKLPRPDLFNHCGEGFNQGKYAGCEGYCEESPNEHVMKSQRLDACTSLRGLPPYERQQSCQAGFSDALELAKKFAADNKENYPVEPVETTAPPQETTTTQATTQGSQGSQGSQDAGAAGTAGATGSSQATRKATVKKVIPEGDRRNLLDEARREAEMAFASAEEKLEL